jgi:hypothetical protein
MVDLNDLLARGNSAPGFYLAGGISISDSGVIIAEGSDSHTYLVTPHAE